MSSEHLLINFEIKTEFILMILPAQHISDRLFRNYKYSRTCFQKYTDGNCSRTPHPNRSIYRN